MSGAGVPAIKQGQEEEEEEVKGRSICGDRFRLTEIICHPQIARESKTLSDWVLNGYIY